MGTVYRLVSTLLIATAGLAAQSSAQPDLSGVWLVEEPSGSFSRRPPPPMTPWALERFAANRPTIGPEASLDANDPTVTCAPPGVPYILVVPTPFEFVHAPGQIIQLFEYSHFVRRIHMDGRAHPVDLRETGSHEWLGHSIGRWDGGTLVIDTTGFNDATWLDRLGRPHSVELTLTERIRRDGDVLQYDVVVHDPGAYLAPWHGSMRFVRRAGWAIGEHTCVSQPSERYRTFQDRAWQH